MNRICIIGIYFGKLPEWFFLWLNSCEYNSTIDFLIFTDQSINNNTRNIKVYHSTLKEFKEMAEEKLKLKISLKCSYKCCDFRPAYGIIFQEYIKQYDYWGHCDFDLIFGDLQFFFEKYDLYSYDKFLPLGHLCLYRNTKEVNERYKLKGSKCGEYLTVFKNERSYAFDETNGINEIYKNNHFRMFDNRIFADISIIYHRFRCALRDKNYAYQVFYWQEGKVWREFIETKHDKEEFIYIHFQKRKNMKVHFEKNSQFSGFYITNEGFYRRENTTDTLETIKQFNFYHGKLYEEIELLKFNILKHLIIFQDRIERLLKME